MIKRLLFAPFLVLILLGCQPKEKEVDRVQLVESYVEALNNFDYEGIVSKFQDSVRLKEIVFESFFSRDQYYKLFQWDSIFQPKYEILNINELPGDKVEMEVSKQDPRILYLNEQPIVTHEIVSFDGNKIKLVEIDRYVIFDEVTWTNNRKRLVNWVNSNHPELNGFLHDQTKEGAQKYMKALEYYSKAH